MRYWASPSYTASPPAGAGAGTRQAGRYLPVGLPVCLAPFSHSTDLPSGAVEAKLETNVANEFDKVNKTLLRQEVGEQPLLST